MSSRSDAPVSKTELLLIAGLLLAATAVRLPYLQLIPMVTDEAFEVLAALEVYHGDWILFGPVNPTAGPLVTYLLAVAFWLGGPGAYLPRIVILVLGVLTVMATYWLGRAWGGPRAGLIAGALLACSPIHILVNSHIAWSNSATPLFATLTWIILHHALERNTIWLWVAGGFCFGLALQTHISMAAAIPGLLVWFLARRDVLAWLRRPGPYLATGAALLGYGNMIAYHLMSGGAGLAHFQTHDYAWVSHPTWATYWTNLTTMVKAVAGTIGAQVPRIESPWGPIVAGVLVAWCVLALLDAAWRGERMPVLIVLSTVLVMPYFNKRYEGLLSQRYTAFLLPLVYAAMGMAFARITDRWRQAWRRLRLAYVGSMLLAGGLILLPLSHAWSYYEAERRAGRDNTLTLTMTRFLRDHLPAGTPLYLSSNLKGAARGDGGYRYLRALYYYLTLEGINHQVLDLPQIVEQMEAERSPEQWLLLAADDCQSLAGRFPLEPVPDSPPILNEGCLVRYRPSDHTP